MTSVQHIEIILNPFQSILTKIIKYVPVREITQWVRRVGDKLPELLE
jgi:hypothetical protein